MNRRPADYRVFGNPLEHPFISVAPLGWGAHHLQRRLRLAQRSAPKWLPAIAGSALSFPRCRLACVLEQILRWPPGGTHLANMGRLGPRGRSRGAWALKSRSLAKTASW